MKVLKLTRILFLLSAVLLLSASCKKDDDDNGKEEPVGETLPLGDGSEAYEIKSNQTLTFPNTYILSGFVYVTNGVTLTIEPGVIIRGDKASKGTLIVERGAKINAEGTAEKPIVFTSNQA
ncbi:MAG: hypothetical protein LBG96_08545, partial [Tannerella sp.]|nr:hypothetical protein [Tannerella sp.]